jgi:hypothetical protein
VLIEPITKSRIKKLKEVLNELIQHILANVNFKNPQYI